jgi:SpoVK/Ycf46/Vps4 family AAA+-type ATPase
VDAGVSSRLLAAFLSWMQERKAPVFVAATCNNVSALPPETIRKGRFDELFFVDLPNQAERKQILALELARGNRRPAGSIWIELLQLREGTPERRFRPPCRQRSTPRFPASYRWQPVR